MIEAGIRPIKFIRGIIDGDSIRPDDIVIVYL